MKRFYLFFEESANWKGCFYIATFALSDELCDNLITINNYKYGPFKEARIARLDMRIFNREIRKG